MKYGDIRRSGALLFLCALVFLSALPGLAAADTLVEYIDRTWKNGKVAEEKKQVSDFTALTASLTELSGDEEEETFFVLNSNVTYTKRLTISGKVGIILCNGYTLTNRKGINVKPGATLTFYEASSGGGKVSVYNPDGAGIGALDGQGTGTMSFKGGTIKAEGGNRDAGIGGGKKSKLAGMRIEIFGGTVRATGGGEGAGIGAGLECKSSDERIVIYGGAVTARGGDYGAGIGGGENASIASTYIYGGTVNAQGGCEGAGIGGGNEESNHGLIEISGGSVTAKGGDLAAGIGGGDNGSGGKIVISGGTVNAKGGSEGAGIGGGQGENGGDINIRGGDVEAKGGEKAAGIGGGNDGNGGSIYISGGAVRSYSFHGAGIGGGTDGKDGNIQIIGGSVKAMSYMAAGIGGGEEEDSTGKISISGGEVFALSSMGAGIGAGFHGDMKSEVTITGGNVYARSGLMTSVIPYSAVSVQTFAALTEAYHYGTGAGIGGGGWGSQDGLVRITDGFVLAWGGGEGAGIGAGHECLKTNAVVDLFRSEAGDGGEGGPVIIGSGATVFAIGGKESCAIGYGMDGSRLRDLTLPDEHGVYTVKGGWLDLLLLAIRAVGIDSVAEMTAVLNSASDHLSFNDAANRVKACQTEKVGVLVMACRHIRRTYGISEDGKQHQMHCLDCGKVGEWEEHTGEDCICRVYGDINNLRTVTFTDPQGDRAFLVSMGSEYVLPAGRDEDSEYYPYVTKFLSWIRKENGEERDYQPGSTITITGNMAFSCRAGKYYRIESAETQHGTVAARTEVQEIWETSAYTDMAPEGAQVILIPTADRDYEVESVSYLKKTDSTGEIWENAAADAEDPERYTFAMPKSAVEIRAAFRPRAHKHDGISFTLCTSAEDLGTAGSWVLGADTALPETMAAGTTNICLNGYRLLLPQGGVTIPEGAALNLYDDQVVDPASIPEDISDMTEEEILAKLVWLPGKGTITAEETLTGSGIIIEGTLNLYAGAVTGITSGGSAVCVKDGGALNLSGGAIRGNASAAADGAGVYVESGAAFALSGDTEIRGNTAPDDEEEDETVNRNVYLCEGAVIALETALTQASRIGVSSGAAAGTALTRGFAESGSDLSAILSDSEDYAAALSEDGEVVLKLATNWASLQEQIDNTADGGTLRLTGDYQAKSDDTCLRIPGGKTITLDLNGFTLDRKNEGEAKENGSVIQVPPGASLTITGSGTITGGNGVSGGAVYNEGTLIVAGGRFAGNSANIGGAIYNAEGGALTLRGGVITENVSDGGGAVYSKAGSITLSGSPIVEGNRLTGGNQADLYLGQNQVIEIGGELSEDAGIGLKLSDSDAMNRALTSGLSEMGTAENFFLDQGEGALEPGAELSLNASGEVMRHQHVWNSAVGMGTFVLKCASGNCEYADGITTKLSVPLEENTKIYDGEAPLASVTFENAKGDALDDLPGGFAVGEISYSTTDDDETLEEAPAAAGAYTASVSVLLDGANKGSAWVAYTIGQRELADSMILLDPSVFRYSGTAKKPDITVANAVETLEEGTDYEFADGSTRSAAGVGEYTVKLTGKGNYTGTAAATWRIRGTMVFFRVVHGAWNDGTAADKTAELGETQTQLTEEQIPAAGSAPEAGAQAGAWDVTPDTVTEILNDAVYTYYYLPSFGTAAFVLPEKTESIGAGAFAGIAAEAVQIQDGCAFIGENAFAGCPALEKVWIPGSVKDTGDVPGIADTAFADCPHVYLYGASGSAAEKYCDTHDNCTFVPAE